jgi:HSP20 family protein
MSNYFQDTFQDLMNMRRQFDRLFNNVNPGENFRNAFLPARSPRHFPLVNVAEDADHIYVEALAPGLNPDTLQISILRNQITISGEKPTSVDNIQREAYHRMERATGKFTRSFTLPTEVNPDQVEAQYRNGMLQIALSKAEAAKPRQIKVAVQS